MAALLFVITGLALITAAGIHLLTTSAEPVQVQQPARPRQDPLPAPQPMPTTAVRRIPPSTLPVPKVPNTVANPPNPYPAPLSRAERAERQTEETALAYLQQYAHILDLQTVAA